MADKSRNWCMILYPDDPSHTQCLDRLQSGYQFACILHDCDLDDNGELKKPHYHVVLKFSQPRYATGIADELGIKSNYLEICRNRDAALLYLVHEGYPDKFQYDSSLVFGSLSPALAKLLVDEDEGERVLTIVSMIDNSPGYCSYREILVKACKNGLYGEFRRLGSGVKYLLDEHNNDVYTEHITSVYDSVDELNHGKEIFKNMRFIDQCERMAKLGIPNAKISDYKKF